MIVRCARGKGERRLRCLCRGKNKLIGLPSSERTLTAKTRVRSLQEIDYFTSLTNYDTKSTYIKKIVNGIFPQIFKFEVKIEVFQFFFVILCFGILQPTHFV